MNTATSVHQFAAPRPSTTPTRLQQRYSQLAITPCAGSKPLHCLTFTYCPSNRSTFRSHDYCRRVSRRTRHQLMASSEPASKSDSSQPSSMPPADYRPNVGICLVNEHGSVFVASRLDTPGAWQMPQGGIDDGEVAQAAAFRELREETGVTSAELLGEISEWITYDFPPDVKLKITRLWGKEWTGQAQKWFLFLFTGEDSEITLLGDGSERPEFEEWKWAALDGVVKLAVPFKQATYNKVFEAFEPIVAARQSTSKR